jgi:hypothetical protein
LKRNGRLTFESGVLQATDRRGRSGVFALTGGDGSYHIAYGDTWGDEADYALVDPSGHAVLLIDQKAFRNDDIMRLQNATGLETRATQKQPQATSDVIALVNPPYLRWAWEVSAPGGLAFALWSVTHNEIFVLGITLPALTAMVALLVLAKTSMMSQEEAAAEARQINATTDSVLADADAFLTKHGEASVPGPESSRPGGAPSTSPAGDMPPDED